MYYLPWYVRYAETFCFQISLMVSPNYQIWHYIIFRYMVKCTAKCIKLFVYRYYLLNFFVHVLINLFVRKNMQTEHSLLWKYVLFCNMFIKNDRQNSLVFFTLSRSGLESSAGHLVCVTVTVGHNWAMGTRFHGDQAYLWQ